MPRVLDQHHSITITAQRFFALAGLICAVFSAAILVANQYSGLNNLDAYYRLNTPAVCLIIGFFTASLSIRMAIAVCVFLLPLLPTVGWQIQQYFGYGRLLDVHNAGLDLAAGILLGSIVNKVIGRQSFFSVDQRTWPIGLVICILTLSVGVAVMRNLHQTSSAFSFQALFFNLLHLRTLDWHDDYRPILDWVSYASAAGLFAVFIPTLGSDPKRNDLIFKPLIISLTISAIVGWRQSAFGMGLSLDQRNFRVDQFGFMALGFQPDIHAFAGIMLIGAVGLLGYVYAKRERWFRLASVGFSIVLCWVALFLSKSKASFALAVVLIVLMALVWLLSRRWNFLQITKSALGLVVLAALIIFVGEAFGAQLIERMGQALGIYSFEELNLKLSYRPEVYLAAIKMFSLFPVFGMGQAEFYRQAANYDLTHSFFLSIQQNGEHAHNYFLQALVENGIVGVAAFTLMLIYPLLKIADKRILLPALVALSALFCANIFSHSLLVRENLLLGACFVALLYSWLPTSHLASANQTRGQKAKSVALAFTSKRAILLGSVVLVIALIAKEAVQSLSRAPFDYDIQCFKARPIGVDGWTSGLYRTEIPTAANGLTIRLATTQPDAMQRPLTATINVFLDKQVLMQRDFVLNKTGPQELSLDFPAQALTKEGPYQIELRVSRCFVPRNFGMNEDSRRLGVRMDSIHWH
jgi:O-antigen ligase